MAHALLLMVDPFSTWRFGNASEPKYATIRLRMPWPAFQVWALPTPVPRDLLRLPRFVGVPSLGDDCWKSFVCIFDVWSFRPEAVTQRGVLAFRSIGLHPVPSRCRSSELTLLRIWRGIARAARWTCPGLLHNRASTLFLQARVTVVRVLLRGMALGASARVEVGREWSPVVSLLDTALMF